MEITKSAPDAFRITGTLPSYGPDSAVLEVPFGDSVTLVHSNIRRKFEALVAAQPVTVTLFYAGMQGSFEMSGDLDLTEKLVALLEAASQ